MKFQARREDGISIPLTPLIDVVFLLLLFFMLTTTFSQLDFLKIQLPQGGAETAGAEARINLAIDAMGDYYLNGQPLPPESEAFAERLQSALEAQPNAVVYIYAHALTPHQSVVHLMAQAREQGVQQLRVATMGERLP